MSEKNDLLDQAMHNKELCLHILELKKFNDWVATTAFYSALHFVKYKLFPLVIIDKGEATTVETFDDYIEYCKKRKFKTVSFHTSLINLVMNRLPDIHHDYRYLRNQSHNARYNMYRVDEAGCSTIIQRLKKIEKYCK